jgi:hypothetical protein
MSAAAAQQHISQQVPSLSILSLNRLLLLQILLHLLLLLVRRMLLLLVRHMLPIPLLIREEQQQLQAAPTINNSHSSLLGNKVCSFFSRI